MVRMILTILLPLITPTVIYFLLMYLKAKWKKEDETAEHVPIYHNWPWFRLIGAGGVLLVITFLTLGFPTYEGIQGKYIPPHMENGELVPGQFVPFEEGEQ